MKKKYLFLCVAFVFFIYVVKFDVLGKLKRQYVEWKQVRFLDKEFHILKSKEQIVRLEKLTFSQSYNKPIYNESGNVYSIDIWTYSNKSLTKQFEFKGNTLNSLKIFFYGIPNSEKNELVNRIEKTLGHPNSLIPSDTDFLQWDKMIGSYRLFLTIQKPIHKDFVGFELELL